ncbi:FkbM family methyltransferase [Pararhizobium arenae]|uniref:FkbM family methyltransferase n=1 Tax=Pararhizobium arenae TaxID=1856850 RepID=UPI0009FA14A8|nr:FkbM family methyltransferase [Pararhizobium arenae]
MPVMRRYRRQLQDISAQAPTVPLPLLLWRLVQWKILRSVHGSQTVPVHANSRMRLDARRGDHGIRTSIYLFRDAYEPSVRFAIDCFVRPGSVCYDIGANQGLWALRMAERAGRDGKVFAFEPIPDNARSLKTNAELSGHAIEIYDFALGDKNGSVIMHLPRDVGSASMAAHADGAETMMVNVRCLDDIWISQDRPGVSLVKLDVEGAELLVLKGASAFLADVQPVVCCEINPERLDAMGASAAAIFQIFDRLGYRSLVWDERRKTLVARAPDPSRQSNVDVVFLPSRLASDGNFLGSRI